jgi:predicted RNA binding protein YcfA (HicA-like mRNA interferase family)
VVDKGLVKIVDKILKNPKNIAFEELSKLLEGFGFECRQPKGGSSHYIFRKTGNQPISVPKAKPVNQAYVKQVVKLLNLEEWYEENH